MFFWPWGMWDLSSPTRNWTCIPFIGRWSLSHWTTREVPEFSVFEKSLFILLLKGKFDGYNILGCCFFFSFLSTLHIFHHTISRLHCFWWEVCYDSYPYSSVGKSFSFVFSTGLSYKCILYIWNKQSLTLLIYMPSQYSPVIPGSGTRQLGTACMH